MKWLYSYKMTQQLYNIIQPHKLQNNTAANFYQKHDTSKWKEHAFFTPSLLQHFKCQLSHISVHMPMNPQINKYGLT